MVYSLLSEWCVLTSFYQNSANRVSSYAFFNLRNLLYLIVRRNKELLWAPIFIASFPTAHTFAARFQNNGTGNKWKSRCVCPLSQE